MKTFEETWRQRLQDALNAKNAGSLFRWPETDEPTVWTKDVLAQLREHFGPDDVADLLTRCGCRFPDEDVAVYRAVYVETGSIDAVQARMKQDFDAMMRHHLGLSEEEIAQVHSLGLEGPAGVRQGNVIVSTKIPKSGWLRQWLQETDPEKRRAIYCHCPRIREAVAEGEEIDPVYCYCGAGFYRYIWEQILGEPVRLEVTKSILLGDDVCQFAIHLPPSVV